MPKKISWSGYLLTILVLGFFASTVLRSDDNQPAQSNTYKLTGLYCKVREDDLRLALKDIPDVIVQRVDYTQGEAVLSFDNKTVTQAQLIQALRNDHFEIKPPSTTPKDKLTYIEIPIVGFDCKGCSCAAYESVYRLDGVEQATASFKEGHVTAWIDPTKTNRSVLVEALKKKGVTLKEPD